MSESPTPAVAVSLEVTGLLGDFETFIVNWQLMTGYCLLKHGVGNMASPGANGT